MIFRNVWLFILIFSSPISIATTIRGRIDLGGFVATEKFATPDGGSNKNDQEIISTEFYLKAMGIKDTPWEMTIDLRDKDDVFGKANKELLQLDNANAFQVQELNARYLGPRYVYTLGRFHAQEVGLPGVDGLRIEKKYNPEWTGGIFEGLSAETIDQRYYQFNANTNVAGLSATYQRKSVDWDKNLFLSHGVVNQMQDGAVDRTYLFHNMIYQWERQSRIISLLYLDFVPHPYIQNGNFIWQQRVNNTLSTQVNLLGIDVIAYSHRQNVRELLAASPYKEGNLKLDFNLNPLSKLELGGSYGKRDADDLTRKEYYVGYEKNKIINRHFDFYLRGGLRNNFTSNDTFAHTYLGYYSRKWEAGVDAEYSVENYTTDGLIKHAVSVELSLSRFLSRSLYGTFSFSRDADETVEIYTAFFRIGYRFGTSEIPPAHDVPPGRGQL